MNSETIFARDVHDAYRRIDKGDAKCPHYKKNRHGRTPEHAHTISSLIEHGGLGELTKKVKF